MSKLKDSIHDIILGEKISDNIYLDNNGQLICENVVLARTGNYDYREDELLENGSPEKIVQVYRSPEEVFDEESIKSMNYKPLVDEHPEDNVTPETVGELQKGFMTNVRRGVGEFSNCLMADLVITDPYVIELVRSGRKRELSVGYTADILEENGQYVMKNIRGNHIALCEAGRAGNARIRDSKTVNDSFYVIMNRARDVRICSDFQEAKKSQQNSAMYKGCDIYEVKSNIELYKSLMAKFGQGDVRDELFGDIRRGRATLVDAGGYEVWIFEKGNPFKGHALDVFETVQEARNYINKGDWKKRLRNPSDTIEIVKNGTVIDSNTVVEAKGSFNSLEELKKHYAGATVNKVGDKCEVTLKNGVKLLYSCLDGDKDGKLLFIRKLNDVKVKPADEVVAHEKYLKGSEDETENNLKDSNNPIVKQVQKELENLGFDFIREGKGLTGSIGQIYELNTQRGFSESEFHRLMERVDKITDKHDFITYNGALTEKGVSLTVSFHTIKDSELPDPADEKELDRTHFIPDAKYKSGTVLKHVDGGKSEVISKVITESGVNGANTEKYLMKSGKKFVTEDIDTSKNWSEVKDSLRPFRVSVGGRKFDTMATSFADAVQKVRSTLRDVDFGSIKDQNELEDLLSAKKYKITFKHGKNSSGDDLDRYTAIHEKDGKGFQWVFNSSKKTMTPVLYRDLKGGEKILNSIREVKAVLGDSISDAELIAKNKELTGSINDVYPNKGESKEDFISRFMSETKEEYPDKDQRLAVAYAYWKKGVKDSKTVTYKGYAIEFDFYGQKEYTVQYQGDDVWFKSEGEAKKFIDDIVSGKITDSKLKDSFAILHPTRNEFLSVGGRSWVKGDSNNIQKFSSYDEAKEFGEKYIDHQFRIFKFFDAKHVIDHDVEETTEDVANAPKSFQLREYVGNLIDDEVEAVQGYDETLLRTDLDEETRKTLEEIRNDELDHTDKLNAIYKSLTKDPKPVEDDMYGLVKEPEFRYFMVTVLEKSAKWGDEEVSYFVRAKNESEARKKVGGNVVRIVEGNHSEYLKFKRNGQVIDAGMVGYLFPKLNRNDLLNAYKYGLGLGAINPFKGEEGTFLLGSLENIKKYARDYLDYELVKGYLVKGESLTGN